MRSREYSVRGRPLGKCYSYSDSQLLKYLAEISAKYNIDPHDFFKSFAYAFKHKKTKCGKLSIEHRLKARDHATFLVMNDNKVVTQFRISEALLRENDPLRGFMPSPSTKKASVPKCLRIQDIKTGMRGINLKAKVLEIPEARVVFTKFGQARVTRALIADETGTIRLALWGEQIGTVSVNSLIKIENGKAIIFRGERQINVGKNGQMKIIEGDSHAFEKELRTN